MKRARITFPLVVGVFFVIVSLPFILGLKIPSIHEGDPYSFCYVVLNLPPICVFGGLADAVATRLSSGDASAESDNYVMIAFCFLFWTVLAFLVGMLVDCRRRQRVCTRGR